MNSLERGDGITEEVIRETEPGQVGCMDLRLHCQSSGISGVCVMSLNCLCAVHTLGKAILIERQNKPITYMKNGTHLALVFLSVFPFSRCLVTEQRQTQASPCFQLEAPSWPINIDSAIPAINTRNVRGCRSVI